MSNPSSFINRMIRAAKLEPNLYEEVEADKNALRQAMAVVVLANVAAGVVLISKSGISGLIFGTVLGLVGWVIWAFLIFIIGTKLLPQAQTKSDIGELLRTIGFASSPGIIQVLAFIPLIGSIISIVASLWMLVAMVIAVRQALDYTSTWRAVGVCVIGWIIYMIFIAGFIAIRSG